MEAVPEVKYLNTDDLHFLEIGHKNAEIRKLKQEVAEVKVLMAKQASELTGLRNEAERAIYLKKRSELEARYGIIPGTRWGHNPETGEIDTANT